MMKSASVQNIILSLFDYWSSRGCLVLQPYDAEVGAGTMAPHTFLRSLGPEPWNVAYVQPSRRPADGRYGENPNRLYQHHQFQVVLKPAPSDVQALYLGSIEAIGIDPRKHDIRFVEDDWESPTLGAWGLGWEVWCDGMEITQFTYFQQCGGFDCRPVCAELTYGLERVAMFVQGVEDVYALDYGAKIKYGEIFRANEREMSRYTFELSDPKMLFELFQTYEREAQQLVQAGAALPAYDYVLKCSHTFNLLDARGAVSVTERAGFIKRVRDIARSCAQAYLKMRHGLGWPLQQTGWSVGHQPPVLDGPLATDLWSEFQQAGAE